MTSTETSSTPIDPEGWSGIRSWVGDYQLLSTIKSWVGDYQKYQLSSTLKSWVGEYLQCFSHSMLFWPGGDDDSSETLSLFKTLVTIWSFTTIKTCGEPPSLCSARVMRELPNQVARHSSNTDLVSILKQGFSKKQQL